MDQARKLPMTEVNQVKWGSTRMWIKFRETKWSLLLKQLSSVYVTGESQHGVILLSAFHLVRLAWHFWKPSRTFIFFFHCLNANTDRTNNILLVMKSHSLYALSKQAHPICAGRTEPPQGFFFLSPSHKPLRRGTTIRISIPVCREGKAEDEGLSHGTATRWPKSLFYFTAESESLVYCITRILPHSHRLCCSLHTLSSEKTSFWLRSSPPTET